MQERGTGRLCGTTAMIAEPLTSNRLVGEQIISDNEAAEMIYFCNFFHCSSGPEGSRKSVLPPQTGGGLSIFTAHALAGINVSTRADQRGCVFLKQSALAGLMAPP